MLHTQSFIYHRRCIMSFYQYFSFPLASFHQCSILMFILKLLLSEGKVVEAWDPLNKAMFFPILGCIRQWHVSTISSSGFRRKSGLHILHMSSQLKGNCPPVPAKPCNTNDRCINPLKTKHILSNIKTQGVPHSQHSPPQFEKPIIWWRVR
jgi:hypothetical protein